MRRTTSWAVAVVVGGWALAGCGSDGDGSDSGAAAPAAGSSEAPSSAPAGGEAVLSTADSALGEIVVDGSGMTVYVFDRDTAGSGKSACSGQCLAAWPAVTADSDTPAVDGVDGDVGTLIRDDGTRQVTLDGLPLYTYAPDAQAGDVTGQGVQGVWWVVAPDGAKIDTPASEAPASEVPPPPAY
jgi:predicted lipoprotein with Yx(FWY)xxD motif